MKSYSFPTRIVFGDGSSKEISNYLTEAKRTRPLLVTDRGLADLSFVHEIHNQIKNHGFDCHLYSGISGNPAKSQVVHGINAYREYQSDSVVAIGGGSVVDTAKAILVLVNHPGDIFDYEDGTKDSLPIDCDIPFFIALPTTAGTGSEVGRSAVISDDETKKKKIIFSPSLLPDVVLADPRLTLGLPASLTAATGMDALTHCIEAYLVNDFHPVYDGIALEGLYLISQSLPECMKFAEQGGPDEPSHLHHRGIMLNASMMGAIAFQKGLGVTHSCAHALSTVYDLHHGLANGIMLPYCMEFNSVACETKFVRMGNAIGLSPSASLSFIEWIISLQETLKIPASLSDLRLDSLKKEQCADIAFHDICHLLNPKKVTREDFSMIFSRAFHE